MISIKWRAGLAVAALGWAAAAVAGPMVLRASGPSAAQFKAGTRVPDDRPVLLKTGDVLVVLDSRGTRSVAGPGSFRFDTAAADAASGPTFAELLTQKTERRARIGAVRGGTGEAVVPRPPGLWAIDAAAGGSVCVLDAGQLSLWRADPAAAATLKVSRDGAAGETPFAPGQPTAAWPAGVAVVDGASYQITGLAKPATLQVHVLQPQPATLEALATALIANSCAGQVERMARLTAVPG